ncbi:MAG TPA: hypothetical protein VH442_06235 [Micromonosporaceae bacterium]
MIDFCSPALFGDLLALCRLHLYLIMLVEFPSRGKTPQSDPDIWHRLGRLIARLVTALS